MTDVHLIDVGNLLDLPFLYVRQQTLGAFVNSKGEYIKMLNRKEGML